MRHMHFVKKIIFSICFIVCLSVTVSTYAASVFLSPSQPQIPVGKTQVFKVLLNTQGVAINTAEGVISFDPKIVEVVSINRANSVFNLWIEEPSFSNVTGKISFNGGAVTPGYTGSAGELFTVTARGVKQGNVTFAFSDVSIHKNDGSGTDVAAAETSSTAIVTGGTIAPIVKNTPAPLPTPAPVPAKIAPQNIADKAPIDAPVLTSNTHPDQTVWYTSRNADISWIQSSNAYGIQSVFDSNPNTMASGPVQSGVTVKNLKGLRNGVSYLHVRQVGSTGVSPTTHFAIRVDTEAPRDISLSATSSQITISAIDDVSGLDHIVVTIDSHKYDAVPATGTTTLYTVPSDIESGSYEVAVTVFDKAGNSTILKKHLTLIQPSVYKIAVNTTHALVGSDIVISGQTSVRNGEVSLSVKNPIQKIENFSLKTDKSGLFTFTLPHVKVGMYAIWGDDERAGESNLVEVIVKKTYMQTALHWFDEHGMMGIILLLLIWIFILSCRLKGKGGANAAALHAVRKLEEDANKSVVRMKDEAKKQLAYLDHLSQVRTLTKAEKDRVELCKKITG